jgi:membrane protease YdiL (CAAX protease family)
VRASSREPLDPTTAVAIAVGVLAVRNWVGEFGLPLLYVPVNLATVTVLAIVSCSAGLSAGEVGLSRAAAPRGVVVGVAVAAIVVAGIAVGAAVPLTRPWFEDQRMANVDTAAELAYQALVRIPLGTAFLEEFAFRGVLLGLLARLGPMKTAVAVSSLLFGLWHIRPTLGTLATNDLVEGAWTRVGAVTAAVALTTVGGLLFCALRLASGSLVAGGGRDASTRRRPHWGGGARGSVAPAAGLADVIRRRRRDRRRCGYPMARRSTDSPAPSPCRQVSIRLSVPVVSSFSDLVRAHGVEYKRVRSQGCVVHLLAVGATVRHDLCEVAALGCRRRGEQDAGGGDQPGDQQTPDAALGQHLVKLGAEEPVEALLGHHRLAGQFRRERQRLHPRRSIDARILPRSR